MDQSWPRFPFLVCAVRGVWNGWLKGGSGGRSSEEETKQVPQKAPQAPALGLWSRQRSATETGLGGVQQPGGSVVLGS